MLNDKIAIVTGAGQGLGRGIVCEMARQHAAGIAVVDRNRQSAEETAAVAKELGSEVLVIECDLRDRDQIESMVNSAAAHFGGLDVLVNNAGIIETTMTADCAVDTLPEDVWDAVYQVNLRAPWLATKFAAPHLRRSGRGPSIVNACSVGGLVAFPHAPAYCVTKGGIAQLTKATAVDLGPAVRCNAYAPGAIDDADGPRAHRARRGPGGSRMGAHRTPDHRPPRHARGSRETGLLPGLRRRGVPDRRGGPDRRRIPGLGQQPLQARLKGG